MTIWRASQPLILASQSATRRTLLHNAGFKVEVVPATLDERAVQRDANLHDPGAIAALLARAKAVEVSKRYPDRVVLGADQTLARGERLFNKPGHRDQAAAQLHDLAGQTHELHAAVALVRDGEVLFADVSVAYMTMRALSDDAIAAYLDAAGDRVSTSVGAYQLEGLGVHLFARIDGDHFTILGLPLLPLLAYLREAKLIAI